MEHAINYTTFGSGIPFVFQHGLGANIAQVQRLFGDSQFVPAVQLITSDARGHGQSPFDPSHLPSFNNYADDVLRVLEHHKEEEAFFGGISMGSGISLNIALRYPERVLGLVLVRPAWLNEGNPKNLHILHEVAEYVNEENGQARFMQTDSFAQIQSSLPMAAKSVMGQFNRDQGIHTASVLHEMVKDKPFDRLSDLANIKAPTLIIGNDDDPLHPWEMAVALHEAIPESQLVKVCSRYVDDKQHKQEVISAIQDFIFIQVHYSS